MAVCEGSRCHFRLASAQTLRPPISFGCWYLHTLLLWVPVCWRSLPAKWTGNSCPVSGRCQMARPCARKDTKATLSNSLSALPPSPPLLFILVSPVLPYLIYLSSISILFQRSKTVASQHRISHLHWNIKKIDCVTGLVMAWHLGPVWLTQLGLRCKLICPAARYIPQ